jgi:hypothetical protein
MTPRSTRRAGRLVSAAALLPAVLFAVSSHASSATKYLAQGGPTSVLPTGDQPQTAQPAPTVTPKVRSNSADGVEARISALHNELHITADQDAQWNDLAQVMRQNGQKIRDMVAERSAKLKTMNAVDDLESYQAIAEEHVDGLDRLIPAFEALYAEMTPEQQKNADHVFGEHQQQASHRS